MAAAVGVSQATISRVARGDPRVRPETRARVLEACRQAGYKPNRQARAMRTRRTGCIGLAVADVTNPFYPEVVDSVAAQLDERGLTMLLWDEDARAATAAVEAIREGLVDGVLIATALPDSPLLEAVAGQGAPIVLMNRTVPGYDCDQVAGEDYVSGRRAAHYLADAGHRRIGLVSGPVGASTARDREAGFRDGLAERGLAVPDRLFYRGSFQHEDGWAAARRFMGQPDPATAVFCVNDLTAFGVIDGARSLGRSVPEDLWVIGFDDVAMAAWESFSLTTFRQPVANMVRLALSQLLRRIEQPQAPRQVLRLPNDLVVRRSTAGVVDGSQADMHATDQLGEGK